AHVKEKNHAVVFSLLNSCHLTKQIVGEFILRKSSYIQLSSLGSKLPSIITGVLTEFKLLDKKVNVFFILLNNFLNRHLGKLLNRMRRSLIKIGVANFPIIESLLDSCL